MTTSRILNALDSISDTLLKIAATMERKTSNAPETEKKEIEHTEHTEREEFYHLKGLAVVGRCALAAFILFINFNCNVSDNMQYFLLAWALLLSI